MDITKVLLAMAFLLSPSLLLGEETKNEEAAGEEDDASSEARDQARLSKMELSPAAQKVADKYMNIILDDPRNEFAFEQVYQVYESEKKTWKLLDFFINAARLQRENAKIQVLLALTYYRFRDYYKAAEHLRKALQLLPNDYYSRLLLGRVYLKQASGAQAKENLVEAVKVASGMGDRVEALLLLGEALMLEGDKENAAKAWDDVLSIQQFDIPTLQALARIYRRHGFLDKSDEMLTGILDLAKKNPRLSCDALIERADLSVERGDADQAIEYLRQAQNLLSSDSALREEVEVQVRQLHSAAGKIEEFFQGLEQRVEERPRDVGLRKAIARLYLQEERTPDALKHVEAALAVDPRDVPLLEQAVELYAGEKEIDKAIPLLDQLYEITGGAPAYLVRKGEILWDSDRQDDARAAWGEIVEVDKPSLQRYRMLTRALRQHELAEEAVESYRKMVELEPDELDPKLECAEYLLSLDRKDEAKEILDALTASAGASATLFLQVAELYGDYDMVEPQTAVLQAAADPDRHGDDYRVLQRLGLALEAQQKYQDAIEAFFKAYDRAPNWRDREVLIDKLISLHLGYGKWTRDERRGGGPEGLGNLILKLYDNHAGDKESAEPFMGLARIASIERPSAQEGYRARPVYVRDLSKKSPIGTDSFPMGPMNAITFYTEALDRDPMRIDAYEGLARSFMLFDEFERAVVEYKKLAIVNPVGKWKYYFAIGDFFASQGQMPEARAFWQRVAERAFTDATLYFRLGARYHFAERPETATKMLRKAIELHPDEYRFHLAYANVLAEAREFAQAIHEYREALRLAADTMQTMLVPVRRTMSEVQISYARDLFKKQDYQPALEVFEEIQAFQEVLNKHVGKVVAEYPDVLVQIARTKAQLNGGKPNMEVYQEIARNHPDAVCWVNDQLSMSVAWFIRQETKGFKPKMSHPMAKSDRQLPPIKLAPGWPVRLYPWVLHAALSPDGLRLIGKYKEDFLDPASGKKSKPEPRKGFVRHFGNLALRTAEEKLTLTEIKTGKQLWQVERNWSEDYKANEKVFVGTARSGKLEALDRTTGERLWEAPACTKFELNDRHVTLKRMKSGKRASQGGLSLEEAATGDAESIGYTFQVLDAQTGETLFERQSTGSHYWRVPVAVNDNVLLVDGFARMLYAYEISSGKLRWQVPFENFFARPPTIIDGKVFMYMRRPKLKTIIQYVLDPETGEIIHQTDLQVNSLYARPIPIGHTLFLYDPVTYELLGVDRENGGVIGRYGVKEALTEVSRRNVVTLEGLDNHLFFYTWDGLIVKFDVGE